MQDPIDPGIAVGNIILTGSAVSRSQMASGDYLPIKNSDGYLVRAAQRRVLGRHEDAISDYDCALALDPKNSKAQFSKGQAYVALGRKEEAIAAFTAAATLFDQENSGRAAAARHWVRRLQADA